MQNLSKIIWWMGIVVTMLIAVLVCAQELPVCHSMRAMYCYPTGRVEIRSCCRTASSGDPLEFHVHKCMVEIWRGGNNPGVEYYRYPDACVEYTQRCQPINWVCN